MTTISIAILTQNRAAMLADCLEALRSQTRSGDEIIVVDNGSTDSTRELFDQLLQDTQTPRLPLRVIDGAAEGGWAVARNKAVEAAKGDWILFTDDDCIPRADWVERARQTIAKGYDAFGGWVEPAESLRYPWWWHPEMAWAVGLSVPGLRGPHAGAYYYPQTANWATRRSLLLEEPFQEVVADFAKDGNIYSGGREDAELWRRLRRKGCRTCVDPRMIVSHRINPDRLRFRQVITRAFQDGIALQRREPHRLLIEKAMDTIVGLPLCLLFGIWGKRGPAREAAWQIVWAARQEGQCAQFRRQNGFFKGTATLLAIAMRCAMRMKMGLAKRLARNIGIGLIRARRRAPKYAARSIVIAANGYLGDMTLLHPYVSALRMQRPEASITLLTNAAGYAIYSQDPAVNDIALLDTHAPESRATQDLIHSALETARAELILVPYFHSIPPKALFSRPQARVVAFSNAVFDRQWWYDRADTLIDKPMGRPESENIRDLFREAGLRDDPAETPLAFLPGEVDEVGAFLRSQNLDRFNLALIAPGSNRSEKLWAEDRWAEIVRYLTREYQLNVALVGAPSEEEMCGRIADLSQASPRVWCHLGIRRLALVLNDTRILLSTCNGAKHLAAAMETPTLALYGPTDERQWGVARQPQRHGAVRACAWDLTDEERIGLPENHQMLCITTARVIKALEEMLGEM